MTGDVAIRRPVSAPAPAKTWRPVRVRMGPGRGGTVVALLALYVCWGSSIPAMKLMVASVPALAGAGVVFILGGLVLGAGALRRSRPISPGAVARAAFAGVVLLVGGQGWQRSSSRS